MQRGCIISQRKTVCSEWGLGGNVVLGFVCVISEICERIGRSHIRKEQGKSKERARNEQGINEHVSSQLCCINMNCIVSTMRQLSFVCEIMQLAAFPLRNQRDLRENWPLNHIRKEQEITKERIFHENRAFILRLRIIKEQASVNNIPYSSCLVCIIFSLNVRKTMISLKKCN